MSETTAVDTRLSCMNCGKPASRKHTCPICIKLDVKDAVFCDPTCYKDNWSTHKQIHQKLEQKAAPKGEDLAPGTFDPFEGMPNVYTGKLRAQYPIEPVPKRTVPASIERPDYADNSKGISFREKVASRLGKIQVLSQKEIEDMRKACRIAREVLDETASHIRPGITGLELDEICHNACIKRNAYPSPLGYREFPRSVCISVNEVVTHGIPDARPLKNGDIVNLDVTTYVYGHHGDVNATYAVGDIDDETKQLIKSTRSSLDKAIAACKPGMLFRDLGAIIEDEVRKNNFTVIKSYTGHGINSLFHCPPNVPHYKGNKAVGEMKPGMCFTIEPMVCAGKNADELWPDYWTAVTRDGKNSAQFEETLLVTKDGVEILTGAIN